MEDLLTIIRILFELKEKKKNLKEMLKEIESEIDELSFLLIEKMSFLELKSLSHENLRITPSINMYISSRNEEKLKTYLKQNGAEWLIKETIPASSLRKWVKDIMEEQEEPVFNVEQRIPEDLRELVNVYLKPVVSIRKL